ncbi:MAG: M20/M25/M40 family metallo-hydrolase, partial [Pseudomonadales bacterium]
TSIGFDSEVSRTTTANVLGLLPGSDPAVADQVVVVTAHHDHLGIGTPDDEEDAIYNGAMDNGAGVAQVLGIARALAALPEPPRRSVLISFVGAEEQGLLGSRYYAEHPTFPPGRIAANVNYDGGNVWGRTRDVVFIGKGKSSLDSVVQAVADYQGRQVKPDQFPDRGIFYRSDQFSFARIGVPAVYLRPGTDFIGHDPEWGRARYVDYEQHRYHQPSDEYSQDWNLEGMVQNARMGFLAICTIADADEMPVWTPGDEFEAARLEALGEED